MTATIEAPTTRWTEPEGVRPRGTVLVFPGRGESAAAYWRLGARLAYDAYRVVVVAPPSAAAEITEETVRPIVALGSDSGALDAVAFARGHRGSVDAVVVAGVPTGGEGDALAGAVESRTACSVQQGVLAADVLGSGGFVVPPVAGLPALAAPTAPSPTAPSPTAPSGQDVPVTVPLLALHGGQDAISPFEDAVGVYRSWGAAEVTVIETGLHDVLNDLPHRTVAAAVVEFLERVRLGAELPVVSKVVGVAGRA